MHFNRGLISITEGQLKKHVTQMSDEEIDIIYSFMKIHTLHQKVSATYHILEKIENEEVELLPELVDDILYNIKESIIEYNITRDIPRVVLRSRACTDALVDGIIEQVNLCLVIDIINYRIITAYYNSSKDAHTTINFNRYDGKLVIDPFSMLKEKKWKK